MITASELEPTVRVRRRLDVSSLIWGLLFLTIAGHALWIATGHRVPWEVLRVAAPAFLICLGVLGIVLSRRLNR